MVVPKSVKAPVEPRRPAHRLLLRAPDELGHVAQDQHEGVGEQELVQLLLAVEVAEEEALDDRRRGRRRPRAAPRAASQKRPGPVPDPLHELVGAVGAEHVEGPVGEVEHAQHAEDEREPGGDEEQEHGGGEAAQRLREDERRDRASRERHCPEGGRRGARAPRGSALVHELRRVDVLHRLHDRERDTSDPSPSCRRAGRGWPGGPSRGSSACRSACRW